MYETIAFDSFVIIHVEIIGIKRIFPLQHTKRKNKIHIDFIYTKMYFMGIRLYSYYQ